MKMSELKSPRHDQHKSRGVNVTLQDAIKELAIMTRPYGELTYRNQCSTAVQQALRTMRLPTGLDVTDHAGFIVPHDLSRPYVFFNNGAAVDELTDEQVLDLYKIATANLGELNSTKGE